MSHSQSTRLTPLGGEFEHCLLGDWSRLDHVELVLSLVGLSFLRQPKINERLAADDLECDSTRRKDGAILTLASDSPVKDRKPEREVRRAAEVALA